MCGPRGWAPWVGTCVWATQHPVDTPGWVGRRSSCWFQPWPSPHRPHAAPVVSKIAHPILNSLKETEQAWLVELLLAFNSGDIARFDELGPAWQTQGDLASATDSLRQKICLLALMELVFKV